MSAELHMLWHRLDVPGHDACRFREGVNGWELRGTAVFLHQAGPAVMHYQLSCDRDYRTRHGRVHGWIGSERFRFRISVEAGKWTLNGTVVTGVEDCVDLDYGFTPATNMVQLRRLSLKVGEHAEFPVAWIDVPEGRLERLPQQYERRSASAYWYESPTASYSALLEVTPDGFAGRYPGLWESERL